MDNNKGTIDNIFLKNNQIIFEIDSKSSKIKNIYVFSNQSNADRFLTNQFLILNQEEKWNFIKELTYINTYTNVDYAKNFTDNVRAEIVVRLFR